MRRTDGNNPNKNDSNLEVFKLIWIFAGLVTMLAMFTGCSAYILDCVNYSDETTEANLAAHKTWCGDCTLVAGNVKTDGVDVMGVSCLYPSNDGCGGKTSQSCYMGCISGEEAGVSYNALMLGDTGSNSGLMAGLVNGCLCVTCDEETTVFGYYLPYSYEAASQIDNYKKVQEAAETIEGCLGS